MHRYVHKYFIILLARSNKVVAENILSMVVVWPCKIVLPVESSGGSASRDRSAYNHLLVLVFHDSIVFVNEIIHTDVCVKVPVSESVEDSSCTMASTTLLDIYYAPRRMSC